MVTVIVIPSFRFNYDNSTFPVMIMVMVLILIPIVFVKPPMPSVFRIPVYIARLHTTHKK